MDQGWTSNSVQEVRAKSAVRGLRSAHERSVGQLV